MSKPLSLFKSAYWNALTIGVTAVAGFVIVPIIIKSIGNENFGIYTIIMMIGGFVGLQGLGLGEATLKYVAQYYSRNDIQGVNRVMGATLTVYTFSAILISGLIIVFAPNVILWFKINQANFATATLALRIAGFAFILNTFNSALRSIPEAVERYDILNKYTAVMVVLKYSAMYFVISFKAGIVGLTYLILVCALIDMLVYLYLAKKLISGISCYPSFRLIGIKEVFSYGIFSFLNDLIQKGSLYIDQIVLGVFYSTSAVAHLTAPKDLITKAQGLTGAAGRALFPRFSSMEEDIAMVRLYSSSLWILTIFSLIVFLPLAAIIPAFLAKWISVEFAAESSDFAVLFSLGIALNGGVSVYQALLKGTGRINWLTKIISTLTVLSAILTAVLVFQFGLMGAGIRVIIFSWVGISLCFYVVKKVFKTYPLWREVIQSAILPVAVGSIFFYFARSVVSILILDDWINIIVCYAILMILLFSLLMIGNFIVFGRKGEAYNLAIYALKLIRK